MFQFTYVYKLRTIIALWHTCRKYFYMPYISGVEYYRFVWLRVFVVISHWRFRKENTLNSWQSGTCESNWFLEENFNNYECLRVHNTKDITFYIVYIFFEEQYYLPWLHCISKLSLYEYINIKTFTRICSNPVLSDHLHRRKNSTFIKRWLWLFVCIM